MRSPVVQTAPEMPYLWVTIRHHRYDNDRYTLAGATPVFPQG
ncbi:hypothetical protein [Erythrobacter insulae]|nr:hypothetical protein [Erythrobacter insulae]